jgi:eukaryotic-like serine/threonine-protein kinase
MRKATGTEQELAPAPLLAAAGSHDESGTRMVAPTVTSDRREAQPATPPTAYVPDDRTRTANETAAPELQPRVAATPLRDPERYQILGEHGRGGLGRVSRAHDRELGRDVAIKELISRGRRSEARFLREALITARLEHPGIVPVHEAGRWPDGTPFYAMKLVAGRPLRDLIAERTTVDQRIGLLHHVIAVADAIAYAHGRNIIHRDLKPANVIVGDFGETIVIDWGLAKDLSATEEPTVDHGPFRTNPDRDLTSVGAVLGTPTYMAPEQERGEHVDQRADVFAIGAMLWELSSLERLPPANLRQRHRLLRRAGIDKDLAVIIDKALAPDSSLRYPDAGALAADLKAFKSGARISARHYSLLAILAHWTLRHRTLTISIAVAIALIVTGSILYIRNVAAERDRADVALERAEAAKHDLILEQAALLLRTDPTAAVAALDEYHGADSMRRSELLAEAHGRGVARNILRPHNDTIWFLAGQPDGSFVSVGEDHRVRQTLGTSTITLASNVSYSVYCAYSPKRRLLAYGTSPNGVALMDLASLHTVTLDTISPTSLRFSSDGTQLAALDKHGLLIVWRTSSAPVEIFRGKFPDATISHFPYPGRLLLLERSGIRSIDLMAARSLSSAGSTTTIDANEHHTVAGFTDGKLALLSPSLEVIATAAGCKQRVSTVRMVPRRDMIAFGCEEGRVGLARYSALNHTLDVVDSFGTTADAWLLTSDDTGSSIYAISGRILYVYNINTRTTIRLEGQANSISAIAAPSPGFPHVLVGDVNGTVRSWDPPQPRATVLAKVPGVPFGARFSPDGATLAVFGSDPNIRLISMADASTTELRGHENMIGGVRFSSDGRSLMSFSWDGTARAWRTSDGSLSRTFADHGTVVEDGDFTRNGSRVVTIGDDGRLFAWEPETDTRQLLLTHGGPLISLLVLPSTGDVVVRDAGGAVWVASPAGQITQIRKGLGVDATSMRASRDGNLLAIGQEDGSVTVYATADWTIIRSLTVGGTIARIEFDPQGRDMVVHSEDGFVRLISLDNRRGVPWQDLKVDARDIAYSPNGDIIAISAVDGGSWFYSRPRGLWSYHRDHMGTVRYGRFAPDGARFVSMDQTGTIVVRDSSTIFD